MDYEARASTREPVGEGVWETLEVQIVRTSDDAVVGSYERDYPSLFDTFCPFTKDGSELALYSPQYTATRVMNLPSCRDLGGEEPDAHGFCPVDYYVPPDPRTGEACDFGFVAGCVWGDDSSWKIQVLDLSEAQAGTVVRDERFGYLELPDGVRLSEAVVVRPCHPGAECEGFWVEVTSVLRFEAASGKPLRSYDI